MNIKRNAVYGLLLGALLGVTFLFAACNNPGSLDLDPPIIDNPASTDPNNPGTDPNNPGTDPNNPGTDPNNPGTGPNSPGTGPNNPGTGHIPPVTNPPCNHSWGDWKADGLYPSWETKRVCTLCSEIDGPFTGPIGTSPSPITGLTMRPKDMVWIPAGSMRLGDMGGVLPGDLNFVPERHVTLTQGFYMSRTQITRAQWYAVMGLGAVPSQWAGPNDNRAATNISWFDAIMFANELSRQRLGPLSQVYQIRCETTNEYTADITRWGARPTGTGHASFTRWNEVRIAPGNPTGYRLPTEAQWEFAARAGTTTDFNDGVTNWVNLTTSGDAVRLLGWFLATPPSGVQPVGDLQPNAWGLFDMHGNVSEWTRDRWLAHGDLPTGALTDPVTPGTGANRVTRGGNHANAGHHIRSSSRLHSEPLVVTGGQGFRLVRP